jgi:hypothetical protein
VKKHVHQPSVNSLSVTHFDTPGTDSLAGVHEGSAKIIGSIAENQQILLAVDLGIYNVRKAICMGPNREAGPAFAVFKGWDSTIMS